MTDVALEDLKAPVRLYTKAWLLTFVIVGLELLGSWLSGSLALLADIGHVATDTLLALVPLTAAYAIRHRFNSKLVVGASGLLATALLFYIGFHVLHEAAEGLEGHHHEVEGMMLFVFAGAAAIVNILQHRILSKVSPTHQHAAHAGLHFHVLTDLVKNIALPVLGLLLVFGLVSDHADLLMAQAIGWLILVRAAILGLESVFGIRLVQRGLHKILR